MFIKQVKIEGFRSYGQLLVAESLSPKCNIIVGRNGSGKSNFFQALQFVLGIQGYSQVMSNQANLFLHQGHNSNATLASVEIILDNSDSQLLLDTKEVSLQRTYSRSVSGNTSDHFYLNKKLVTRKEVARILEAAGFCLTNPYYVVRQGMINDVAMANQNHRLKMILDIAGIKVYDERREESLKLLMDAEERRREIRVLLDEITQKVDSLALKKKDIVEYQDLDKKKRALEYLLLAKKLKGFEKRIENMEKEREVDDEKVQSVRNSILKLTNDIHRTKDDIVSVGNQVKIALLEKEDLAAQDEELMKKVVQLDLVIGNKKASSQDGKDLWLLNAEIEESHKRLKELQPKCESERLKAEKLAFSRDLTAYHIKELQKRQGHSLFQSQGFSIQNIQGQLKEVENIMEQCERNMLNKAAENATLEHKIRQLEKELTIKKEVLSGVKQSVEEHTRSQMKLTLDVKGLEVHRQHIWRQQTLCQEQFTEAIDIAKKNEVKFYSLIGRDLRDGLLSMKKIIAEFQKNADHEHRHVLQNYHGLLMDCIDCNEEHYLAVQVTAGSRLLYHVTSTDMEVNLFLREMKRQRLPGTANFIPLNRMMRMSREPTRDHSGAVPLIKTLHFDDIYRNAVEMVFGHTLLCSDINVATQLAKKNRVNCVTLDGDIVSSSGSMTGGTRTTANLPRSYKMYSASVQQSEDLAEKVKVTARDVAESSERISKIHDEIQKVEMLITKCNSTASKAPSEIESLEHELEECKKNHELYMFNLEKSEQDLGFLRVKKDYLCGDLNHARGLTGGKQKKLDELQGELRHMTSENKKAFDNWIKLQKEIGQIESFLKHNLLKRKRDLELNTKLAENTLKEEEKCRQERKELESSQVELNQRLEEVQTKLQTLLSDEETLNAKLRLCKKTLDHAKKAYSHYMAKCNKYSKDVQNLELKRDKCAHEIKQLSTISEYVNKYEHLRVNVIESRLERCKRAIAKYSNVNLKLLELHLQSEQKREALVIRERELDKNYHSVKDLMRSLEQQKSIALDYALDQISVMFNAIFKKLIPCGIGRLILCRSPTNGTDSANNVDGVKIEVSFTGQHGRMTEMNQLSGGQKSLVALTLIFSLQKYEPAAFYLFDEIDQALDPSHREAVANVVKELSRDSQFILTTFRPELLAAGDKFFGVVYTNKNSHIDAISKAEAVAFVV